MAAKFGSVGKDGHRRSVASLSNVELLKKGTFDKKHLSKIENELKKRGLSWE